VFFSLTQLIKRQRFDCQYWPCIKSLSNPNLYYCIQQNLKNYHTLNNNNINIFCPNTLDRISNIINISYQICFFCFLDTIDKKTEVWLSVLALYKVWFWAVMPHAEKPYLVGYISSIIELLSSKVILFVWYTT
jgi:hypothetical protein